MRILLLGSRGQVGCELAQRLPELGAVTALGREDLDLADLGQVRRVMDQLAPELVVNAAAYTAVERAENEPELARRVNGAAPGVLAEAAARIGAGLVHFSTDYVFDGSKHKPYSEDDAPNPINVYGESKLDGERAIRSVGGPALILRLSWVYSLRRASFVSKVLSWAAGSTELRIAADQISIPTWCASAAEATVAILRVLTSDPSFPESCDGLFHLASAGEASRYNWAKEILRLADGQPDGASPRLIRAKGKGFQSPAPRPAYSVLDCGRLEERFGIRLPHWREDLNAAFAGQTSLIPA